MHYADVTIIKADQFHTSARSKQYLASNLNLQHKFISRESLSLQKNINTPSYLPTAASTLVHYILSSPTRCGSSAQHLKSDSKGKQSHPILIS